jgi:hypothetical protein
VKTLSYTGVLLVCFAFSAHAAGVYTGCAVPPSTFRHVWYFDPVHGKTEAAGGNGSQAAPWNNLQALTREEPGYPYPLLTTAPYRQGTTTKAGPEAGPVEPGDEILLMSGHYGNVLIGGLSPKISNSDFVTVAAAPGQTPVLTSLFIGETNRWAFNGLKVQSLQSAAEGGNALVQIKDGGATLTTSDIVLENMTISSQDNVQSWSQAQWVANARNGFSAEGTDGGAHTRCVSLTGSHISNVRTGASLAADQLVFSTNQIDHFGDDGIDFAASDLAITKNQIYDSLNIGDGIHKDAMQGQIGLLPAGATVNYFRYILIDSNVVIRQKDPELAFPSYLQGIDAFDSDWTIVTVTNNVVITGGTCWGIAFSSIHNSQIVNNTVVQDGFSSGPNCAASVSVGDKSHEGMPSSHTAVRNNLASRVIVYNVDNGVEADHNVAMCCAGSEISWYANGAPQNIGKPGIYNNGNIIDSGGPTSEFVDFDPSRLTYNVMLKYGANAIGVANEAGAPIVDILGVTRKAPYTAGAYSYPK